MRVRPPLTENAEDQSPMTPGNAIPDRGRPMSRPLIWAATGLLALTLVRLWVAAILPLAPDEAYYWVWSRALAPGYLDHPPMAALWIRAGTALAGQTSLGVRLLGPLSAALGTVLLYHAAQRLFPGRHAGLTAAALLNATPILGVGAVIMTPDTPLLLFWTATLWAGAHLASGGSTRWWLMAGFTAGLALSSKYTAAFLPLGLGLFALIAMPRSLRRPEIYIGGLIALALFLPVIAWNAQNDWAGFLKQGGRVSHWRPERAVTFLSELVLGQIGLASPGVFVLFAAGIGLAIRITVRSRDRVWTLLAAFTVPPALLFLEHAIGDRVQGNWPAILYPAAAIAAAGLTAPRWRRLTGPSAALGFAIVVLIYAHGVSAWPSFADLVNPVARQLRGWDALAARAETARLTANATILIAEPYGLAAELAWSSPPGVRVLAAGDHWIRTTLPRAALGEGTVLLIRPERHGEQPDPSAWRDAVPAGTLARTAAGGAIERYSLFLVRAVRPDDTAAALPRRRAGLDQATFVARFAMSWQRSSLRFALAIASSTMRRS